MDRGRLIGQGKDKHGVARATGRQLMTSIVGMRVTRTED